MSCWRFRLTFQPRKWTCCTTSTTETRTSSRKTLWGSRPGLSPSAPSTMNLSHPRRGRPFSWWSTLAEPRQSILKFGTRKPDSISILSIGESSVAETAYYLLFSFSRVKVKINIQTKIVANRKFLKRNKYSSFQAMVPRWYFLRTSSISLL